MNTRLCVGCAALALVLTVLFDRGRAEESQTPASPGDLAKAFAEADQPGRAHAELQPLAGDWTYTCKIWMAPGQPPIETKGTVQRKWILGGRFLEESFAGTGFDGKPGFEAFGLLGYDNSRQKYTYTWACNMGTGTSTGLGESQTPGSLTLQTTCYCPILKTTLEGRDEIRMESSDRVITESFHTIDGQEVKAMEVVAVRKK